MKLSTKVLLATVAVGGFFVYRGWRTAAVPRTPEPETPLPPTEPAPGSSLFSFPNLAPIATPLTTFSTFQTLSDPVQFGQRVDYCALAEQTRQAYMRERGWRVAYDGYRAWTEYMFALIAKYDGYCRAGVSTWQG